MISSSKVRSIFYIMCCTYFALIQNAHGRACGKLNHNKITGGLVPANDKLEGETCNWHIRPEKQQIPETYIVFEEFQLDSKDECTISEHNGSVLFGPFSGNRKSFSVLAGYLAIDVSLTVDKTALPRKFKVHYTAEKCDYYIDQEVGHIASPLYHDVKRPYDVIVCTWRFRDFKGVELNYRIKFEEFHLTNSTLHVKYSNSSEKVLTGTDIPSDLAIPEKSVFELHLNTKVLLEKFSFDYYFGGHNIPDLTTSSNKDITPTPPVIINDIPLICGKSAYSEEHGTIVLGDTTHTTINFECSWNIDCEDNSNAVEVYIQMEEFLLADDDKVTVLDTSDKVKFGPYNGKREQFSILTGVKKLQIKVEISQKQKFERKLKVSYNSNGCINQLTNEKGIIKLPLYNSENTKSLTCSWIYSPSDKESIQKISFLQHKFSGQLLLEGNIHPKGNYLQNDVPYVLAKESGIIKLSSDIDTEMNFVFIHERVISDCSSYIELTDKVSTFTISSASKVNAFDYWANCFWIAESPKGSVISIEVKQLNLNDVQDYVIITDGNNIKSPVLSQLNTNNENKINEKEIISRNNSIVIFFHTQFVHASNFEAKLSISKCLLFCENGFCMLEKWKCNGMNDCGDFTDEKDCNGTVAFLPTIKPVESNALNNSGVSQLAIGLAVPAAFVAGIIITVGFAAAKQMYRSRAAGSYGEFPIYNDS